MRQELDYSYDINVDNMVAFNETQLKGTWVLSDSTFYSAKTRKSVKMVNLSNGIQIGCIGAKQIMQMKDGKFILEVEDEEGVEYFFSENLDDLI